MSSNQVHGLSDEGMDEESVTQYLQQNPEFFERHPQLLARLRLQHPRNGTTVSLIERQVEVLRDKYQAQEQKLTDFVRVARANNVLADKIHRFACRLLKTTTRAEAITQIEASLREDFDTFHAVLLLAAPEAAGESGASQRFLRHVGAEDTVFRSFDALFATCKPRCGQLRDSQRDYLFGSEASGMASVALVPLGGQPPLGLLALGSVDPERFHPGMSTEFLSRIGELVSEALSRD